jgi:hypothetical protein
MPDLLSAAHEHVSQRELLPVGRLGATTTKLILCVTWRAAPSTASMIDVQDGHGVMLSTDSGNMKLYRKSVSFPGWKSWERRTFFTFFSPAGKASKT